MKQSQSKDISKIKRILELVFVGLNIIMDGLILEINIIAPKHIKNM